MGGEWLVVSFGSVVVCGSRQTHKANAGKRTVKSQIHTSSLTLLLFSVQHFLKLFPFDKNQKQFSSVKENIGRTKRNDSKTVLPTATSTVHAKHTG
jgi:hypothetical protein